MSLAELVQIIGALVILAPYLGSQLAGLRTDTATYLWPNALGSLLLAVLAVVDSQWGFALLEGVWCVVAFHGLFGLVGGRRKRGAALT